MISATKQFTFDCAHLLSGHEGACKNLHGHTYQLFVEVARTEYPLITEGPSDGMIVDFKELKGIVNELIVDKFDHAFICWSGGQDPELAITCLVKHHQLKYVELPFRPTAENMAIYFGSLLDEHLPKGIKLVRIRLYETPTSFADYTPQ